MSLPQSFTLHLSLIHTLYMSDSILDQVIQHPEVIYTLAQELVAEREQLEGIRKQLDAAQPKADYFDTCVNSEDCTCSRNFCKMCIRDSFYREHAADPILRHYYVETLALAALTVLLLSLIHISGAARQRVLRADVFLRHR